VSDWFRTYGYADVLDQLLIGAYPLDQEDVATLKWLGVERVLNLVEDDEYRPGQREVVEAALAAAGMEEDRLRLVDYGRLPAEALEIAVQEVLGWLREGERVYLHCRAGWQRSAAVAAGVVALTEGLDIDEALSYVKIRKPTADPMPQQRQDLFRWWADRDRDGDGDGSAGETAAAD
jgi:protein-tyrosine phosphatase